MAPAVRVFPARPLQALATILSFTAVLWVIEFYDQLTGEWLDADGIVPRSWDGLDGILWAPLLHGGFAHLAANTLPFVVLGFLVLANGIGRFVLVTAVIWVLAGLGVWLTAPYGSVTVGMSGVIFGWLTYLLVRGLLRPQRHADPAGRRGVLPVGRNPAGRPAGPGGRLVAGAPVRGARRESSRRGSWRGRRARRRRAALSSDRARSRLRRAPVGRPI